MADRLRLVFMGSPDFSVPTLAALLAAGHEIACVYSQPPRPAGRGKSMRPTPVHAFAEAEGLVVRTPKSLKSEAEQARFAALGADAGIVIAYGLILPQAILDAPRHGCMNLHASRLPRWRGAAPIQRAIMAGDKETGVDAMVMEAGLDTGPVIASETVPIGPTDTAGDLHDRLATLAARLAPAAIEGYAAGTLVPVAQPETGMTYAYKIEPGDQPIDWSRPARAVDGQVRGLAPLPGATFRWSPEGHTGAPLTMKALGTRIEALPNGPSAGSGARSVTGPELAPTAAPGTCLDGALLVACGEGAVRVTRLQRPGKAPMDAAQFLNGTRIAAGTVLG